MPVPTVAVIGAGAAGLTAMKAMLDEGVDVVGFDRADRVGGLWVQDSSSGLSPAYDSLHLNTSKGRTELADYPMPAEWEDYPAAHKVAQYLAAYADEFGLTDHIRFSTTVDRVEKVVDAETGTRLWEIESTDDTGAVTVHHADAVVVANGHNWDPAWPSPEYPGTFTGTQMHAHDYRSAEVFRGKRVMVVGMGNSAMDIAVDASYVANDVLLSARHGSWIVPKYLFGRPADATGAALTALPWRVRQQVAQRMLTLAVGTPQSYGLPAPSHGLFQNHPTISDTILHRITHGEVRPVTGIERFDGERVRLTDGRVEDVDVIVWATGYRVTIPFLSHDYLGERPESMPLFHRVFHLDDPSLMFTGLMQSTGAALPVVEAQAKLAAAWVSGAYSLPTPDAQLEAVHAALGAAVDRWGAAKRPMMRIDFDAYLADTSREIARGRTRARRGAERFGGSLPATISSSRRHSLTGAHA
jgi:cation diffusion facilitator CzcD-associated flavoprotein CzcO